MPARRAVTLPILFAVIALVLSALVPATTPAAAQSSDWAPPSTVYIPETGQSLDQLFLDLWRGGGGAAAFGNPITPEITQPDGHIVQYLEYARFEYWPEGDANGNTVLLGKLGEELRPMSISRTAVGASKGAGAAIESAKQMQAWAPVDATKVDAADGSVLYIEETRHTIQHGFLTLWQNTGGADYLGNPLTEEYTLGGVTYQVFERGQLAWQEGRDPWLVSVGQVLADKYKLDQSPIAQGDLPAYSEDLFTPPPDPVFEVADAGPGAVPGAGKSIVISLSQQRMWAYEGGTAVMSTYVSTGRPEFATPTGMFSIVVKKKVEDMAGVIGGEYYDVPEVPDVMYFTDVGHAIHGAYWHNNFGSPMSHGCVNLPLDIAEFLFDWTPMGTPVQVVA